MRPMGGCQRRKPKIIAMHMAKRNDHLHRQREQRQLCEWSNLGAKPIHRLIDPDPLANTCLA